MQRAHLIQPHEWPLDPATVILDCRFSLQDPEQGYRDYCAGHIPGARYLHLDRDLSGSRGRHGGRHPLPPPRDFVATLAAAGITPQTEVVVYDDNRLGFAARLWWMMRGLGYRSPRLLDGGYRAWLATGREPAAALPQVVPVVAPEAPESWRGVCDIIELPQLQARGAVLVDAREARRYAGLEEPIDPVAGHIPGAQNRPWQALTDADGRVRPLAELKAEWRELLAEPQLVVYCGSGVTACVNLFALALLGREDALLYGGSWSDWCSYL
jgi:thiosulfate/3-mercaptopyruvate sulfurtransferase